MQRNTSYQGVHVLEDGGGCATCGGPGDHLVVYDPMRRSPTSDHWSDMNERACRIHAERHRRGGAAIYPWSVMMAR